jgi:hypothetical protein
MNSICWSIDPTVGAENPSACVLYLKIPCRALERHFTCTFTSKTVIRQTLILWTLIHPWRSRVVVRRRSLFRRQFRRSKLVVQLRHVPGRSKVLTGWIGMTVPSYK